MAEYIINFGKDPVEFQKAGFALYADRKCGGLLENTGDQDAWFALSDMQLVMRPQESWYMPPDKYIPSAGYLNLLTKRVTDNFAIHRKDAGGFMMSTSSPIRRTDAKILLYAKEFLPGTTLVNPKENGQEPQRLEVTQRSFLFAYPALGMNHLYLYPRAIFNERFRLRKPFDPRIRKILRDSYVRT